MLVPLMKQILFGMLVVVDFLLAVFVAVSDNNGDGVDDDDCYYFCQSFCLSQTFISIRRIIHFLTIIMKQAFNLDFTQHLICK